MKTNHVQLYKSRAAKAREQNTFNFRKVMLRKCHFGATVIWNTEITDNNEIVEAVNEHFASIGEKLAAQIENISINPVDAINKADTKFKFKSIEVCQIIKIIKSWLMGKQLEFTHYLTDL